MFRNYLTIALRNIVRHKLYSFINIAGLTVGLACAIFIILFVRDQLSYDRWIPGAEHLYRVERTIVMPGRSRGIGLAILVAAARQGANAVLPAKTDKPDPGGRRGGSRLRRPPSTSTSIHPIQ